MGWVGGCEQRIVAIVKMGGGGGVRSWGGGGSVSGSGGWMCTKN